jgi:hypothetical protein
MAVLIVLVAAASSLLLTNVAHARDQATGRNPGLAHVVSAMEADMASLLDELGLETTAEPTSHGIPQRLDAIDANATYVVDTVSARLEEVLQGLGQQNALMTAGVAETPNIELGLSVQDLFNIINDAVETGAKLQEIKQNATSVNIGDMFASQLLLNHLSQLSERITAIISVANDAIASQCRNCRG